MDDEDENEVDGEDEDEVDGEDDGEDEDEVHGEDEGPLRWTVSSMWPEDRMTLLGLTRSTMMMMIPI